MSVLPAGSPGLSPSPWQGQEQHWYKNRAMEMSSDLGEGWRRSPAWQLLATVPPTCWQSRHVA